MQKIVVLNPKGGSGKSTVATNLASYFAVQDQKPTIMDLDPQGSSMRWLSKRTAQQPHVYGVAGFERKAGVTRSFALRVQPDSKVVIVDSPAAIDPQRFPDLTRPRAPAASHPPTSAAYARGWHARARQWAAWQRPAACHQAAASG